MRSVLITGGTGVIGSAITPLFLAEPETRVRLLIRARDQQHLQERVEQLFAFWQDDVPPAWASRLEAVGGDVTEPQLGIDDATYSRLGNETTHIVHAAGDVKLNQSLQQARITAVASTQNIAEFAQHCQRSGQFQKLEFISTVGVAGGTNGVVPEQPLTKPRKFRNTYEQAKAEAENLMLDEMRSGLPATIHRPSMVVGDSRNGKTIRFQVFYYLSEFLAGIKTHGVVPSAVDKRLDIVPVDYVARAIYLASGRSDAQGQIFHLCSGPDGSWPLPRFTVRLREIFQELGYQLPKLRVIPPALISRILPFVGIVFPGQRRVIKTLPFFLNYLEHQQVFSNTQTSDFLCGSGLSLPAVDDYLGTVLLAYSKER